MIKRRGFVEASKEKTISKPNIYEFLDYREFMIAMVEYLRSQNQYSIRTFANKVGFKSSAFMKMVTNGTRNLSGDSIRRIAEGFKLQKTEAEFFAHLVDFNQAENSEKKDEAFRRLMTFKKFQEAKELVAAQYEFFKHWYVIAILESMGYDWAKKKPAEMARSLSITERQVTEAIQLLEDLQLIERKGASLRRIDTIIETPAQTQSINIRNFHREMIHKALESIESLSSEERELGGVTIPLSRESYDKVKKKLHKIRREIAADFSDEPDAEKIFQLNFQLFPILNLKD